MVIVGSATYTPMSSVRHTSHDSDSADTALHKMNLPCSDPATTLLNPAIILLNPAIILLNSYQL